MTQTVETKITQPVYQAIVSKLIAIENCSKSGNFEWKERHEEKLAEILETAPSGSGVDNDIHLLVSECGVEKLVFSCDFHHMDENGSYDGWTTHKAIITPSLFGQITIRITGRNRNDIKDYLGDLFHYWLTQQV